jgi:hypothetical protein
MRYIGAGISHISGKDELGCCEGNGNSCDGTLSACFMECQWVEKDMDEEDFYPHVLGLSKLGSRAIELHHLSRQIDSHGPFLLASRD